MKLVILRLGKLTASSLVLELPDSNVNSKAIGPIVLHEAVRCKLGQGDPLARA